MSELTLMEAKAEIIKLIRQPLEKEALAQALYDLAASINPKIRSKKSKEEK